MCSLVSNKTVLRSVGDSDKIVLLQFMKIPSLDGSLSFEEVLWDDKVELP